jgi:predicted aspartyl protease
VFSEYGRVYLPIEIKPNDAVIMSPVKFKVDTGADGTTISKNDLFDLGYDMDWLKQNTVVYSDIDKPTTASGEKINAGYVQLPLINIFGYEGKYWPFQIIIDEDKDFRNLIGRDLLTGFNYWFNNDEDIFTIERAKVFKPRYPFRLNQEIHDVMFRQ